MNFKKNKDVKRSSYYVWFLGSKESKGLRGDEYVTPVLNYFLDSECDPPLEPSKVTLQVSSKGLKIVQILTVPRKSSQKLSADQQSQLFANSRLLETSAAASSMLKSEQVKHHIPHNSITWVYQEEDIICAILLLYNPLTRCPVHVHAYRCDSIETADSLRGQLQALVNRPENQKKFADIESRLRAKGLLLLPSVNNGYADEEPVPIGKGSAHVNETAMLAQCYPNKQTLKSDGRSTRTDGSDENCSEESNSSDLGYAVRSKNHHGAQHNNKTINPMMMMIPPPPPMHHPHFPMPHHPENRSSKKKATQHLSPPPTSGGFFKLGKSSKQSKSNKQNKPSKLLDEEELPPSETAALYDSLAAELRAKLGNPKMGPLLLPPRDYDGTAKAKAKNKENANRQKMSIPLTRSESSGKSSSGISSEEALSSENAMKKSSGYYRSGHYQGDIDHEPQSFNDIEHHHNQHKQRNSYMFGAKPNKSQQMYSLQNVYSSDEEEDERDDEEDFHQLCDQLEVDAEDIEENVLFTANLHNGNRKCKSTFDLLPKSYKQPFYAAEKSNGANGFAVESKFRRQPQPSYPSPLEMDHPIERKSRSKHHHQGGQEQQQMAKMYASNPNLSRNPAPKEVKQTTTGDKSGAFVMGRREQRTQMQNGHQQHSPQLISGRSSSPTMGKFAFAGMPPTVNKSSRSAGQTQPVQAKQTPKFYFADAEFGESSKVPFFLSSQQQLEGANGGDGKFKANKGMRHQLGRSSGNLACLDYTNSSSNGGPTSLGYNNYHQQQYAIDERSPPSQHFRPPRQETRYEMSIPVEPPAALSKSKSRQSYAHPFTSSPSKAVPSSGHSRGGYSQQQYNDHIGPSEHDMAMRKKLEQPYSRYSYIDVDHSRRESQFHYVPPSANRR